jgi:hypothetical protein
MYTLDELYLMIDNTVNAKFLSLVLPANRGKAEIYQKKLKIVI